MTDTAATNTYTLSAVGTHNEADSCWVVIRGKVYDVTRFLEEHPGGEDIIIENSGKDATEEFEDIGHSQTARELLEKYEIGVCHEKDPSTEQKQREQNQFPPVKRDGGNMLYAILFPLLILLMAVLYTYLKATPSAEA